MTDRSPYSPPNADVAEPQVQLGTRSKYIIALVALFAFLSGVGDGFLRGSEYYGMYQLATTLAFAVLALAWYQADAKDRGRARSSGMQVAIVLITIISIPVYLFRSRGAGRGALATILFVAFILGCGLLIVLGEVLVTWVVSF